MVPRKVAKRKGGPSYTDRLSAMERLLATHEEELQKVQTDQLQLEWRELVLLDVLRHQEALGAALRRLSEMPKLKTAEPAFQLRSPSQEPMSTSFDEQREGYTLLGDAIEPRALDVDCTRPFADMPGESYVMHLLQDATQQQLQQVLDMTVEDWIEYFRSLYRQLAVLLNLASHATEKEWAAVEAATAQHRKHTWTAISDNSRYLGRARPQYSEVRAPQSSCWPKPVMQYELSAPSRATAAASQFAGVASDVNNSAAAAAMAAIARSHQAPGKYVPGACLVSDMLRLNRLVDECFTLLLLATMTNPMPVNEVMYIHLGTKERYYPPPAVKRVIASSLQLTRSQAEQLAVASNAFRYLHSAMNAKCTALADKASDVGIMVAAAAAEKAKASLTASAASLAASAASVSEAHPAAAACRKAPVSGKHRKKQVRQKADAQCCKLSQSSESSHPQESGMVVELPEDACGSAAASCSDVLEEGSDSIEQQLHGNLYRRLILQLQEYNFISNTLTHVQKAALLVSSYPSALIITATANAVDMTLERLAGRSAEMGGQSRSSSFAVDTVVGVDNMSEYWRCMLATHEQQRHSQLLEQRQQWFKELEEDWGFVV